MPEQITRYGRTTTFYSDRELDRIKGHKRSFDKRGPNDAFWCVDCECGWHKGGFIKTKREAIAAHREHVQIEMEKVNGER